MSCSKVRNGQGAAKAVRVLGEEVAAEVEKILGCPLDLVHCQKGKDGRWYRVTVPEGVAAAFDRNAVSVRAANPGGIVTKLLQHPERITASASG